MNLAALTTKQTQLAIGVALDAARSGVFVDLVNSDDFTAPTNVALRAEAKLPKLASLAVHARYAEGLTLAEDIGTELATCLDHASDAHLSWSLHNAHAVCLTGLLQTNEAEHQLALALIIAEQTGNEEWRSTTLLNIGRVQIQNGQPIAGARTLASVIQQNASDAHKADGYNLMGRLVEIQGEIDEAVAYRRTALAHCPPNEPLFKLRILAPYVLSLIRNDERTEAHNAIKLAEELVTQCNNPLYASVVHHLRALVLAHDGNNTDALMALHLTNNEVLGAVETVDTGGQFPVHNYTNATDGISLPLIRAEILLADGQDAKALQLLDQAAQSTAWLLQDARHCDLAAEACRRLQDWERAIDYQEQGLAAHRRSRGSVRGLLRLHRKHALANRTRRMNKTLMTVQSQLLAVQSQHNELLDVASQDVMSPLTSLRLVLHQLQQDPDVQHENQRLAEPINDALARMTSLIPQLSDMRDYRDPAGGDGTSHTNIEELLGELVRSHQWTSAQKSVSITLSISDQANKIVLGNPPTVAHVLDAILSNAVQVAPQQSSIEVNLEADGAANGTPPSSGAIETTESVTIVSIRAEASPSNISHDWFNKYSVSTKVSDDSADTQAPSLYLAQKMATSAGASLTATPDPRRNGVVIQLTLPIPLELRSE